VFQAESQSDLCFGKIHMTRANPSRGGGAKPGVHEGIGADGDSPVTERCKKMQKLSQFVVKFIKAEDGPTAVEYAVMLALIIVVCITAVTTLGSNANKTFTSVGSAVNVSGSSSS
jgi:pilus assembly protein Flp/PilA